MRVTSQIYQSMSFSWARHCGLFDFDALPPFILPDANDHAGLLKGWRTWVSRELQLRALLGHYVLDGQLSFLSGQPPSVAHTTNPLTLSGNVRIFDAQTVDEWFTEVKIAPPSHTKFRDIYGALFESQAIDPALDPALGGPTLSWSFQSQIDVRVALEGIHSVIRESQDPLYIQSSWRSPTPAAISSALLQVRRHLEVGWSHNSAESLGLLMRWHFVSLDAVSRILVISKELCRIYAVKQNLFRVEDIRDVQPSLSDWIEKSEDAKRALLHAAAIQDIAAQLPLSHINSMWTPMPIFSAATLCALFCLHGISTVSLPSIVDWNTVLDTGDFDASPDSYEDKGRGKTQIFLASNVRASSPSIGQARNLRYDLNSLQTIIHGLSVQWGVCVDLEYVLQSLKAHYR